ncbi:hypothetical protein D3C80_761570 [compost metagenome]
MPDTIGPPGTKIIGRWPKRSAPIIRPGTILSQMPSSSAPSNMLWDSATAVDNAITSRLGRLSSMPGSPWVTPSHMAGVPPANWPTEPISRRAFLISSGKTSYGWCAESMSLYDETIAMFAAFIIRRLCLSSLPQPATPWAKLAHCSLPRIGPSLAAPRINAR